MNYNDYLDFLIDQIELFERDIEANNYKEKATLRLKHYKVMLEFAKMCNPNGK